MIIWDITGHQDDLQQPCTRYSSTLLRCFIPLQESFFPPVIVFNGFIYLNLSSGGLVHILVRLKLSHACPSTRRAFPAEAGETLLAALYTRTRGTVLGVTGVVVGVIEQVLQSVGATVGVTVCGTAGCIVDDVVGDTVSI